MQLLWKTSPAPILNSLRRKEKIKSRRRIFHFHISLEIHGKGMILQTSQTFFVNGSTSDIFNQCLGFMGHIEIFCAFSALIEHGII